jgi:hypothetical protein
MSLDTGLPPTLLSRSRFLAGLSGMATAVAGAVFFGEVLNAPAAFADECQSICGFSCCPGCVGGWCSSPPCQPLPGFCQPSSTCWTTCVNGTIFTCCDFTQSRRDCTCVGTDGFQC